jgi:hypothetical protein
MKIYKYIKKPKMNFAEFKKKIMKIYKYIKNQKLNQKWMLPNLKKNNENLQIYKKTKNEFCRI